MDNRKYAISKRNARITKARLEGRTLQDIGTQYNISRERVRQIVVRDIRRSRPDYISRVQRIADEIEANAARIKADRAALAEGFKNGGDFPIIKMELSVRTSNCLRNARYTMLSQVIAATDSELLRMNNFGIKSLNEIRHAEKDPLPCP